MRGRRSEQRTGRCTNRPATPTPLTNEGNRCRDITMNFVLDQCASGKIGPHVEILSLKEHNYRWEKRRTRDQFLAARKNRVFVSLLCYFLVIVGVGKGQISGIISRLLYFLASDIFIPAYVLGVCTQPSAFAQ